MAEPLKNQFGKDVPERIADRLVAAYPRFERARFLTLALAGYDDLELTPRARQISDALASVLPRDRERAIECIIDALEPAVDEPEMSGMSGFVYLPFVFFVADHCLEVFEASMRAQYELTKRFTAEFSIRAFIERYPEETLGRLGEWSRDPSVHVRRLVSEGTRPRLPWAPRLRGFQEDPSPVLVLLESLKDDPEEYVRRSVANNLNDISKDHPERVIEVAARWWEEGGDVRRRLVRHALRTLVKAGDPRALKVLGFGADSPATLRRLRCNPDVLEIGGKVRVQAEIENPSTEEARALLDFRVHFVKANGVPRPKVFKGAEMTLQPGELGTVRKTISVAQHSTRKHYAGTHRVEVILNGVTCPGATFELR